MRVRPCCIVLQVCGLGEEAHLNTCFKHFIFFTIVSTWPHGRTHTHTLPHARARARAAHALLYRLINAPPAAKVAPLSMPPACLLCCAGTGGRPTGLTRAVAVLWLPGVQHFNLVDGKELAPLQELIDQLMSRGSGAVA